MARQPALLADMPFSARPAYQPATIDSFPDPVLVVDDQSHVEMANPAARRLLGVAVTPDLPWTPPEELRQPLTESLRDQRAFLPEGFDRNILFSVNGQEHSLLPRILPIRDPYGNTLGAAVLLQDVTRFRLLDQMKSNLVSTVSHELKTPLTGVRLALHLLLEETVGRSHRSRRKLVDARENAERLLMREQSARPGASGATSASPDCGPRRRLNCSKPRLTPPSRAPTRDSTNVQAADGCPIVVDAAPGTRARQSSRQCHRHTGAVARSSSASARPGAVGWPWRIRAQASREYLRGS